MNLMQESVMSRSTRLPALFAAILALAWTGTGCERNLDIGPRARTSAALSAYESCDALLVDLREHLSEEMRTQLLITQEQLLNDQYYWGGPVLEGDVNAPVSADAGAEQGGTRQAGVDFSGTNNQEAGVDEADIVKTDGYFIYVLNNNKLRILGVPEFGQLEDVSSLALEGNANQMLIGENRAIVFSNIYAWNLPEDHPLRAHIGQQDPEWGWYWHGNALTKVTVIDLDEARAAPTVTRELYLEGNYLTGRRVESNVRMASYSMFDVPGLQYWPELPDAYWNLGPLNPARAGQVNDAVAAAIAHNEQIIADTQLDDFLPRLFERLGANVYPYGFDNEGCANFSVSQDGQSRGFTSLLTVDLDANVLSVESDHVMSNWPVLYASEDTLILAELAQDWWWYWGNEGFTEATNLHRFDITGSDTTYTGSGRVAGVVTDQFALDVHEGQVRVAATQGQWGRWWEPEPEPPTTAVTVLEGDSMLVPIGMVGGIAPDERLWSVRFTDNEAFLVTFMNIDPLWTIDLSNPRAPQVIGELEVPGVSTYIHPMDEDHLLTIGIAGTMDGLDWGTTQLSLFDVGDFANPALDSSLQLSPGNVNDGWSYSYSEATYEHKAFQYWGPQALLAIPLSTYRWTNDYNSYEYRSTLTLVHAAAEEDLTVYGTVDHSDFYNSGEEGYWWDHRDVRRSIFMGDFIYAISDRGVTAHRIDDLTLSASVELEGTTYDNYYYYDTAQ
jgi:uncharacterized secreted protein with C-terminal beta-propeller domain